jgi:hypothetical protein
MSIVLLNWPVNGLLFLEKEAKSIGMDHILVFKVHFAAIEAAKLVLFASFSRKRRITQDFSVFQVFKNNLSSHWLNMSSLLLLL